MMMMMMMMKLLSLLLVAQGTLAEFGRTNGKRGLERDAFVMDEESQV